MLAVGGDLGVDVIDQAAQRGQQLDLQGQRCRDVQRRWDGVIAALPRIDRIIRADRLVECAAGERGQHLVGVHIAAGARAGLEHIDREMAHEIGVGQQGCDGLLDGFAHFGRQLTEPHIRPRCRRLDLQQRGDEA